MERQVYSLLFLTSRLVLYFLTSHTSMIGPTLDSPSETFATLKAPYIKYLSSIKDRWKDAEAFERELQSLARSVKPSNTPSPPNRHSGHRVTLAKVFDVRNGHNSSGCALGSTPTQTLDAHDGTLDPTRVSKFLRELHTCEPNVHTRIIVLNSERTNSDAAVDSLLFCHILGVELDLPLKDVQVLSQVNESNGLFAPFSGWPYYHSLKPGSISCGPSLSITPGLQHHDMCENSQKRSVASYLGRRKIGSCSPHLGMSVLG